MRNWFCVNFGLCAQHSGVFNTTPNELHLNGLLILPLLLMLHELVVGAQVGCFLKRKGYNCNKYIGPLWNV